MEIFTIIPYCDGQNLVVEKAIYEFNQKLLLEMIHFGNDILSLKTKDKEELKTRLGLQCQTPALSKVQEQ